MSREESIEEINEILDTLSPLQCRNILRRVSAVDLLTLSQAIAKAINEGRAFLSGGSAPEEAK